MEWRNYICIQIHLNSLSGDVRICIFFASLLLQSLNLVQLSIMPQIQHYSLTKSWEKALESVSQKCRWERKPLRMSMAQTDKMSSKYLLREGKPRWAFGLMSEMVLFYPWKAIGRTRHLLISLFIRTTLNSFWRIYFRKGLWHQCHEGCRDMLEAEKSFSNFCTFVMSF